MGTNYYLNKRVRRCEECDHALEEEWHSLHIGKASAGWVFALRVYGDADLEDEWEYPFDLPDCLADWRVLFARPDMFIDDEYGREVETKEMLWWITGRRWTGDPLEPDPGTIVTESGLLRHLRHEPPCEPGGSWALVRYEFS